MKNNRSLLGIIGVIAAAVIIYFGFFNTQPAGEDLQATIGTVAKHQNEQISNEDVVLAGEVTSDWSDDPVVVEAMASILERATIAQRSFAYLAAGRRARTDLLMAAGPDVKSAVLGKVAFEIQIAAFKRIDKNDQEGMYARMKLDKGAFDVLSRENQASALGTLGARDRSLILARIDKNIQLGAVAKIDPEYHSQILGRASKHELARVYQTAPELKRVEMFQSLPLNERQSLMGKVFVNTSNNLLQRATPIEVENLRNQMSEENSAALFSASSVHDQLVWAGRAVRTSPNSFATMGRVQKQDTMGRLFLQATAKEQVAFFRAQPVDVQNELYGKMSITRDAWGSMELNARAKALSGLSLERRAAILARVDAGAIIGLAGRADPAIQKEFVGGLSRIEMSNALKRGASSREVHDALGRQPAIRNAVFAEIPADVQVRIMGRMVNTSSSIE